MIGVGIRGTAIARAVKKLFSPSSLFAAGEVGAWYDPSDLTTLYQDSAGTTPVTAVEQPVGLMLDKSKGLVLGSELATNGDFSNGTTGWTADANCDVAVVGGYLEITQKNSGFARAVQAINTTVGKTYLVTAVLYAGTGSQAELLAGSSSGGAQLGRSGGTLATSPTSQRLVFTASGTTTYISAYIDKPTVGLKSYFDNISVKELPGNHAYQSTSAARPVLSARVNLLTYTEDFSNAVWANTNATKTNATTITATATSSVRIAQGFATSSTSTYTYRAKVLKGRNFVIYLAGSTSGTGAIFNGTTGAYSAATTIGTRWSLSSYSCATDPSDTNYWIASVVVANTVNDSSVGAALAINNSLGTTWGTGWDAVVGDTLTATQHDLRVSNDGVGIPTYQRVNTSTDYDTTGFPLYIKPNGSSQFMVTNSINFTGTDKMTVWAGVRKLSDPLDALVAELSANSNSTAGAWYVGAPVSSSSWKYAFQSGGTVKALAYTTSATYTAPVGNVVSGLGDIAGSSVILRANGFQVANSSATQGTGNFGNYPLYLFARAGSSLWFGGRFYGLIVRGAQSSAQQISDAETYLNGKTKAY